MTYIYLIIALLSAGIALAIENFHADSNRDRIGFYWGNYIAVSGILSASIAIIAMVFSGFAEVSWPFVLAHSIILLIASARVFSRTRVSWVVATIFSLNPIFWIVNYFYGRKRWNDLKPFPTLETLHDKYIGTRAQRIAFIAVVVSVGLIIVQILWHWVSGELNNLGRCLSGHYCRHKVASALIYFELTMLGISFLLMSWRDNFSKGIRSLKAWIDKPDRNSNG